MSTVDVMAHLTADCSEKTKEKHWAMMMENYLETTRGNLMVNLTAGYLVKLKEKHWAMMTVDAMAHLTADY
jgi:hypothetical protein